MIFHQILIGDIFTATNKEDLLFEIITRKPNVTAISRKTDDALLEQMIVKLLQKNPIDRYQNALVLKRDLQLLQENKLNHISAEVTFLHPKSTNELCGRADEINALENVFLQVAEGQKRLVFIQGRSGSGKTSLVYYLQTIVIKNQGYFIEYKLEQRQQFEIEIIIQPIRQLLKQLYLRGNDTVEAFRRNIKNANLMITEQLLKQLPELKQILSKDTVIMSDEKEYTLQQNVYLFSSIIKIVQSISAEKIPIVILIDDCQWAEEHAIESLKRVINEVTAGYLLLITTARDENMQLVESLLDWQQSYPFFTRIRLRPFEEQDVYDWLSKSIVLKQELLKDVAVRLFHYTNGNPLFLKEVFNVLLKNGAFYFDQEKSSWCLQEDLFEEIVTQKDIVGFISERVKLLSYDAQHVIKLASCIGRLFSLELLLHATSFSDVILNQCLDELIDNGFIVLQANKGISNDREHVFRFVHDRFQLAVYEAIPEDERQQSHYLIGKLLMELESTNQMKEIVQHFNFCIPLLSKAERQKVAIWNYELGVELKSAGLYDQALQLFLASKRLLPENHWQSLRAEALKIYTFIGECAFLCGNHQQSQHYINVALKHTETSLEKLLIYRMLTFLYFETENNEEVLQVGYLAFAECGIKLPDKPKKWDVLREYLLLRRALQNKTNEMIMSMPLIKNPEIEVLIQIIVNIISSSFRMDANLSGILLLRAMRLMMKYGLISESAVVFINYALVLAVGFEDIKQATRFGKLAVELAEKQNNPYIKTRVYFSYGTFIHYWEKNYEASVFYIRTAQHFAKQCGLNSIVSASSCFILATQWMQGMQLKPLYESLCFEQVNFKNDDQMLAKDFLAEFRGWIEAIREEQTALDWQYDFALKDQSAVITMHHILRLQMSYYFNDIEQAKINMECLAVPLRESFNLVTVPLYYLYRALWQYDFLSKEHSKKSIKLYKRQIKESVNKFKKWAKLAPQNFEHYYMLLLAEQCNMKGLDAEAMLYYDRALQLAKIHQFNQDVGLIYERAAKYYTSQKDYEKSKDYITRGIEAMQQWGASEISRLWDERYETLLAFYSPIKEKGVSFDLKTVLETSQTLAREIRMVDLLQKLLYSLLKHANATSAYFMRVQDGELKLLAMVEAENMAFSYFEQGAAVKLPILTMANFVLQCEEPVLIANVQKNSLFTNIKTDARSTLCVPVYHKGSILAVLYFENTLLFNAFSMSQLELIQMVTTQIAVSIENAEMYAELEQRVLERTKQYEELNHHLMEANVRLERNEMERKRLFQSISHDLRSPITSSIGYIEAILDDIVTEPQQQREYLTRSKIRLVELKNLINDLFELAKLEAGRIEYEMTIVNVNSLFDTVGNSFHTEIQNAGLSFEVQNNIDTDSYIFIDVMRIQQVVMNFMTNAIQCTPKGGIRITFSIKNDCFCCEVEDSGIGIPSNELPFIFDTYFRASNSNKTNAHGVGLAICKQIVEQHNGFIEVESMVNEGSMFRFLLPIVDQQQMSKQ